MTLGPGNHDHQEHICSKIRSLLIDLTNEPSNYDQIAQKVEYWIEYVLRQCFATVDELVVGVSSVARESGGSHASVGRFLKEFHDAPHRSEQARTFVTQLCPFVLRSFAISSVEDLWFISYSRGSISNNGPAPGFIRAASFVGYLIEWSLLSRELIRQHLVKPLISHHQKYDNELSPDIVRATAIYQLFAAAGNSLLCGLLGTEDVQVCFEILDSRHRWITGFDPAKLQEFRKVHAEWVLCREEEERTRETKGQREGGEEGTLAAEASAEIETPVAFVPRDLPIATINIEIPSAIPQDIESPSVFNGDDSSPEPFIDIPPGTASPTLSISTVSDLTPSELDEEIEGGEKQATTHHDTFYFEDGNVEIICRGTVFRVHSTIISFSSSKLREILSQPALLSAPTPEGRPRITISDSPEDFSNLLKMFYTVGFPARHQVPEFGVFSSLLRMTTKYGFSDVRDQLVEDLRGAYPTKWEDFRSAKDLGEDVFGSPKPHPNAVLSLFEEENVRFAVPFAAYRASIGGVQALMSDKPGTVLSRRVLVGTVQGMHTLSTLASDSARIFVYTGYRWVQCPMEGCAMNVDPKPVDKGIEAPEKVYSAIIAGREGGLLSPPSLKHLCTTCQGVTEANHASWSSRIWEHLPRIFRISRSGGWDGL